MSLQPNARYELLHASRLAISLTDRSSRLLFQCFREDVIVVAIFNDLLHGASKVVKIDLLDLLNLLNVAVQVLAQHHWVLNLASVVERLEVAWFLNVKLLYDDTSTFGPRYRFDRHIALQGFHVVWNRLLPLDPSHDHGPLLRQCSTTRFLSA